MSLQSDKDDKQVLEMIARCPGLTAMGIAVELGVSDLRVYGAIRRLRAAGLVQPCEDERPAGWEPVDRNERSPLRGTELIAAERQRQLGKWSIEHDADHADGELAVRAAELAVDGIGELFTGDYRRDGWDLVKKHRGNRVRQLTIAGALIAAEIDRVLAERDGSIAP